jgi:hypothetical protein
MPYIGVTTDSATNDDQSHAGDQQRLDQVTICRVR